MCTSSVVCEAAVTQCEDGLEAEQHMRLPSTGRFSARFKRCELAFQRVCVGPSLDHSAERMQKAWRREEGRFKRDYNDKIFNGLVILTLADVVIFRFIVRITFVETAGWVGFIFLQVYPKLYITGGSLYDATWWKYLVRVWEAGVWSGLDLEFWAPIVLPMFVGAWLTRNFWRRYGAARWAARPWQRPTKRVVPANGQSGDIRDLDV